MKYNNFQAGGGTESIEVGLDQAMAHERSPEKLRNLKKGISSEKSETVSTVEAQQYSPTNKNEQQASPGLAKKTNGPLEGFQP